MSLFATSDDTSIRWHGVDGYALDLPASCAGFLVRWFADGGTRGELLINDDTGGPLVIPAVMKLRELYAWLGGRVGYYLLSPVDAACRRVDAPDAAISLTPSMAARAAFLQTIETVTAIASPAVELASWWPPPPVRVKGGAS